jgi:hypothetical protein
MWFCVFLNLAHPAVVTIRTDNTNIRVQRVSSAHPGILGGVFLFLAEDDFAELIFVRRSRNVFQNPLAQDMLFR